MAAFDTYPPHLSHPGYTYPHFAYHQQLHAAAAAASEHHLHHIPHEHIMSPILPSPAPTRVPSPSTLYAQLHSGHYPGLSRFAAAAAASHHFHPMHSQPCSQAYTLTQLHPHAQAAAVAAAAAANAHQLSHYHLSAHDLPATSGLDYRYGYPNLGMVLPAGYHEQSFDTGSELGCLPINSITPGPASQQRDDEIPTVRVSQIHDEQQKLQMQHQQSHLQQPSQQLNLQLLGNTHQGQQEAQIQEQQQQSLLERVQFGEVLHQEQQDTKFTNDLISNQQEQQKDQSQLQHISSLAQTVANASENNTEKADTDSGETKTTRQAIKRRMSVSKSGDVPARKPAPKKAKLSNETEIKAVSGSLDAAVSASLSSILAEAIVSANGELILATNKCDPHLNAPRPTSNGRKGRTQVKVACQHCKRACKKCDAQRPCLRCARLGLTDCSDAPRKERKKGFKRGPYKTKKGSDDGRFFIVR
jgi:hypothetical protein